MSRGLLVVMLLASTWLGGCCCFGDYRQFMPPERDDQGAVTEARRFFQEQADVLVRQATDGRDAGPWRGGECVSGLGALATDVAVAVITRGHAGGDSAAEVSIDLGQCFDRVVVLLVLTAGVWHAVRAVAYGEDGEVARLGSDPGYLQQESVGGGGDIDFGSDELF